MGTTSEGCPSILPNIAMVHFAESKLPTKIFAESKLPNWSTVHFAEYHKGLLLQGGRGKGGRVTNYGVEVGWCYSTRNHFIVFFSILRGLGLFHKSSRECLGLLDFCCSIEVLM